MDLERVIVSESQLMDYYQQIRKPVERGLSFLRESDLLPLNASSFGTSAGNSLLELATWIYLSGVLQKLYYTPQIFESEKVLTKLKEEKFNGLGLDFRIARGKGFSLTLTQYGGVVGRLLYCMGVGIPHGTAQKRITKPYVKSDLPKFFYDLEEWRPDTDCQKLIRLNSLDTISRIIFFDKIRLDEDREPYLSLDSYANFQSAYDYGEKMVGFLQGVFNTNSRAKFLNKQIDIEYLKSAELHWCKIKLTPEQMSSLAKKSLSEQKGPILTVNY